MFNEDLEFNDIKTFNNPNIKNIFKKGYDIRFMDIQFYGYIRHVSYTTIRYENNKITFTSHKNDFLIIWMLLWLEFNVHGASEIFFNKVKLKIDQPVEELIKLNIKYNYIESFYKDKKKTLASTQTLVYLVSPYRHDNYYLNKEFRKIKNQNIF